MINQMKSNVLFSIDWFRNKSEPELFMFLFNNQSPMVLGKIPLSKSAYNPSIFLHMAYQMINLRLGMLQHPPNGDLGMVCLLDIHFCVKKNAAS